jgi:cytochrome c-type biogenesis protein CcmH/NrfF
MGIINDLLGCKHEYEEEGIYKKLRCKKCQQENWIKVK